MQDLPWVTKCKDRTLRGAGGFICIAGAGVGVGFGTVRVPVSARVRMVGFLLWGFAWTGVEVWAKFREFVRESKSQHSFLRSLLGKSQAGDERNYGGHKAGQKTNHILYRSRAWPVTIRTLTW